MARFCGNIGYSQDVVEVEPGVWEGGVIEREYFGDILQVSRKFEGDDKINPDISIGNSFSIMADAYANEHFFAMKYIVWAGARWTISNVEVQRPRLILRLGGLYNGPTP